MFITTTAKLPNSRPQAPAPGARSHLKTGLLETKKKEKPQQEEHYLISSLAS